MRGVFSAEGGVFGGEEIGIVLVIGGDVVRGVGGEGQHRAAPGIQHRNRTAFGVAAGLGVAGGPQGQDIVFQQLLHPLLEAGVDRQGNRVARLGGYRLLFAQDFAVFPLLDRPLAVGPPED